jgi:hypothetical protein
MLDHFRSQLQDHHAIDRLFKVKQYVDWRVYRRSAIKTKRAIIDSTRDYSEVRLSNSSYGMNIGILKYGEGIKLLIDKGDCVIFAIYFQESDIIVFNSQFNKGRVFKYKYFIEKGKFNNYDVSEISFYKKRVIVDVEEELLNLLGKSVVDFERIE